MIPVKDELDEEDEEDEEVKEVEENKADEGDEEGEEDKEGEEGEEGEIVKEVIACDVSPVAMFDIVAKKYTLGVFFLIQRFLIGCIGNIRFIVIFYVRTYY